MRRLSNLMSHDTETQKKFYWKTERTTDSKRVNQEIAEVLGITEPVMGTIVANNNSLDQVIEEKEKSSNGIKRAATVASSPKAKRIRVEESVQEIEAAAMAVPSDDSLDMFVLD